MQIEAIGGLDYRFDFNMTTGVVYVDDDISTDPFVFTTDSLNYSTNIKMIEINTTTEIDGLSNFTLRAYSCNIGEGEIQRGVYE